MTYELLENLGPCPIDQVCGGGIGLILSIVDGVVSMGEIIDFPLM